MRDSNSVFINPAGCDSIATLVLTIAAPADSMHPEICYVTVDSTGFNRVVLKPLANPLTASYVIYSQYSTNLYAPLDTIDANTLEDLPEKHVDTGAGLERIATVIQGKKSNYDSDLFLPIIHKIESLSDFSYEDNPIPFRVIADHIRM